jgi:hypothetical protein
MATYEKYMKEVVSIPWAIAGRAEDDAEMGAFKFSPQQIKNLKTYVLGMEGDVRHVSLKRGIIKLNSNKPLNADEAGSVKDFCLDVLDGNTAKFKALMV